MKQPAPKGYIRKSVTLNFRVDVLLPPASEISEDAHDRQDLMALHAAALEHYADEMAFGWAINALLDYADNTLACSGILGDPLKVYLQASRHVPLAQSKRLYAMAASHKGYDYLTEMPPGETSVQPIMKIGGRDAILTWPDMLSMEPDVLTHSLQLAPILTVIAQTAEGLALILKMSNETDLELIADTIKTGLQSAAEAQERIGAPFVHILVFVPDDAGDLSRGIAFMLSRESNVPYEIISLPSERSILVWRVEVE